MAKNTARASLRKIVKAAFPTYNGRKIRIKAATQYHLDAVRDGGSWSDAVAYNLATGKTSPASSAASNPFRPESRATVEIPEGVVIVEHAHFCGQDAGITVYARPENITPALEDK